MSATEPSGSGGLRQPTTALARPHFPSRADSLVEAIRESILSGERAPGDLLVEQGIAMQFGVSKTPVREALRILAASGLVTLNTYKGASVRIVDEELMRSVYEVRAILEPEALKMSLARNVPLNVQLAATILDTSAAAIERADYAELSLLNRRYHQLLYEECGNGLLVQMLDSLRDQTALISTVGWQVRSSYGSELDEHRAILTAASRGEADGAARLLREHISRFQNVVIPAMAASAGEQSADPGQ